MVGGAAQTVADGFALVAGPSSRVLGLPGATKIDSVAVFVRAPSLVSLDPTFTTAIDSLRQWNDSHSPPAALSP